MRNMTVLLCLLLAFRSTAQNVKEVDICIYGGTSAGVIAGYTAKKMNKSVVIIEPGRRLGGLTSGGLGYTDIGNKYAITGLSRDFYRRIGKHYGRFEQWIFEPGVAEQTFQQYIREGKVPVRYGERIVAAKKTGNRVTEIQTTTGIIRAKMFIDCSYEGDLMAKAGISYTVGREDNTQYGETYNGVQLLEKHQFPDNIDPYKEPGKPESGLLWGISPEQVQKQGTGDKKIQAYNFRICLTNDPANRIPITQPEAYDPAKYELLLRVVQKLQPKDLKGMLKMDLMPNHKTDINNNGPFSTDMIGMNYNYPEADAATREKIRKDHELYNKGLLYFIGHDERMPEHLRKAMLQWGYPKDEYPEDGHWSPQMYVREARRMTGSYVMTQANCQGREVVKDGIGMAAYTMDSHNCQRVVVNGMVKNEGDVQIGGFGPYPIAYRSIIPKEVECSNVLVPVCMSATHIAYGSIRMEPVFMVLAQSAVIAASMAIDNKQSVQQVNITALQSFIHDRPLVADAAPEILVDNDDSAYVTMKGDWKKENKGSYGPDMYLSKDKATIRYQPAVTRSGNYKIYTYVPKRSDQASNTVIRLSADGNTFKQVSYTPASIKVEGQTTGEWVDLGTISLKKNARPYVEIINEGHDGEVVADAVLFYPL
jgi:hypothetical protein